LTHTARPPERSGKKERRTRGEPNGPRKGGRIAAGKTQDTRERRGAGRAARREGATPSNAHTTERRREKTQDKEPYLATGTNSAKD
jgi:hypothetical protein